MQILIGAIIFWAIPIFVAHAIGKPKQRAGFLYGVFLGWIGVIVVALLPTKPALTLEELERNRKLVSPKWYEERKAELLAARVERECPFCKEAMRRDANVCPHCRHESSAWTFHEGHWWSHFDGSWHKRDELTSTWEHVNEVSEAEQG